MPRLDINHQDREGVTSAILASFRGYTECLRILADTDRVDWNKTGHGKTPLYWALSAAGEHPDIINILSSLRNIDNDVQYKVGGRVLSYLGSDK